MKTPGLIDIQVNGFAGVDFNSVDIDVMDLRVALEAMLASGVTGLLPTFITAPIETMKARLLAFDHLVQTNELAQLMCLGVHLEGPFLNPGEGYAGCHPAGAMRPPDIAIIDALQAELSLPILMVTLAPEYEQAPAFIRALRARHIVAALGHSAATHDDVRRAVQAGASLSTHLGNGLAQQLHKFHNPLMAQLGNDQLYASFIADGLHIPPFVLQSLIRAKGAGRSILVTDAVSAAGMAVGRYNFAGMEIVRNKDGRVTSRDGSTLAGSCLTLDKAVANIVAWGIASFDEAVAMASTQVVKILREALEVRHINLPESALEWRQDLTIKKVQIGNFSRDYA